MSIKKVNTKIDFVAAEHDVLRYWEEKSIFEKRKNLNKGKQKWSFIDGPITANNPMGVHHAWGRSLKDIYNRYKSMSGYELSKVISKKFNDWRQKYNIYWIAWNNNFDRGIFRVANAYMNLQLDDLYAMNTKSPSGNFNYEIDALSFAHAIKSFGKSELKVPLHPKTGRPSFQLGLLCEENSIEAEGELHTAIVDTKLMMNFILMEL